MTCLNVRLARSRRLEATVAWLQFAFFTICWGSSMVASCATLPMHDGSSDDANFRSLDDDFFVLIRALGSVVSHVSASVGSARYLVLLIFFVLMMLQRKDPGDRHIISKFVMMSCLLTGGPDVDETGASVANTTTVSPVASDPGSTPPPDHDAGNKPAMVCCLLTICVLTGGPNLDGTTATDANTTTVSPVASDPASTPATFRLSG